MFSYHCCMAFFLLSGAADLSAAHDAAAQDAA